MVHEINAAEAKKNKEFVNLHQENKKRKFGDIGSNYTSSFGGGSMMSNNSMNGLGSGNNIGGRIIRKVNVPSHLNPTPSDEELNAMVLALSSVRNSDEAKDFLKGAITNLISKFYF